MWVDTMMVSIEVSKEKSQCQIQGIGEWLNEPVADEEERVISVEITTQMNRDEIVDLILEKCQQYYQS